MISIGKVNCVYVLQKKIITIFKIKHEILLPVLNV